MSGRKISYVVPLISASGDTFIPSNRQMNALKADLERKFPDFEVVGFSTTRMSGYPLPVGTVRMVGMMSQEKGVRLIQAEVKPVVAKWVQDNERHFAEN